jgi:hypothetical protein
MVVAILGEECGRAAMLVQLDPPAVEFDLMQPLLRAVERSAKSERLVASNAQACGNR